MSHLTEASRGRARHVVARIAFAFLLTAVLRPAVAEATVYYWIQNGDGQWTNANNWAVVEGVDRGYPNGVEDQALINQPYTRDIAITLPDASITLSNLVLGSPVSISLKQGGANSVFIFGSLSSSAQVVRLNNAFGRTDTIGVPIRLITDLNLAINDSAQVSFVRISSSLPRVLRKVGTGEAIFAVANDYGSSTIVNRGTLTLKSGSQPAVAGTILIENDATLKAQSLGNTIGDASVVTVADRGRFLVQGPERIAQLIVKDQGQVQVSNLPFLFSGILTVTNLDMIDRGSMGFTNARFVLEGRVRTSGTGFNGPQIHGTGSFELTRADQTFTVQDTPAFDDLTISILVTSPRGGGLLKDGTGTLRLSGNSTYSGTTRLAAGTLIVFGAQPASPIVMAGGSTIGGVGTAGPITATAGGTIAPGISTGRLSSGSIALGPNTTFAAELSGVLPGTHDQLIVTGTVSLGNARFVTTVDVRFDPAEGNAFPIITNDGTDPVIGTFAGLPEGTKIVIGREAFRISYRGGDGNDVVLTTLPSLSYFLTEGETSTFFTEDVLIANPNTSDAPITLTFRTDEDDHPITQERIVPAQRRLTLHLDDDPALAGKAVSVQVTSEEHLPLVVERSMFWDAQGGPANFYGGHTATAAEQPARRWFFAEGGQQGEETGEFDTVITISNPNAVAATATLTFLRENEGPFVMTVPVGTGRTSRATVATNRPELIGRSFGLIVDATQPVTVDRAMYFATTPERVFAGGHANGGVLTPSTSWFHADGATGNFFSTFILLANPQDTPANVRLEFLLDTGGVIARTKTIPAKRRLTVNPATDGDPRLNNAALSTIVVSDVPIVSERSMYWPAEATPIGEGHNSAGATSAATRWGLAEGRIGGDAAFETFIVLANASAQAATVRVTYLRENDVPIVRTLTVPATSRLNLDVGTSVPELRDASFGVRVDVTNNVPIVVERSMYWTANGIFFAGGSNALGTALP